MPLAPILALGFEMILLRMLAFRPVNDVAPAPPVAAEKLTKTAVKRPRPQESLILIIISSM